VPSTAKLVVPLLAAALVAACSARPLKLEVETEDAGPDAPPDVRRTISGGAPAPSSPGACDPVSQNCSSGRRCMPNCQTVTFDCLRDEGGSGTYLAVCSKHFDCVKGFACAQVEGSPSPRCLRHCRSDADCPTGTRCTRGTFPCSPTEPRRSIEMSLCQERRR
jgi:hypothetical protein